MLHVVMVDFGAILQNKHKKDRNVSDAGNSDVTSLDNGTIGEKKITLRIREQKKKRPSCDDNVVYSLTFVTCAATIVFLNVNKYFLHKQAWLAIYVSSLANTFLC